MKALKILLFITMLPCLYGCHGDYHEFGDGYVWVEGCIGLTTNEKTRTFEQIIHERIKKYNIDDNYIIAHQKIKDSVEDMVIAYDIETSKGAKADSLRKLLDDMIRIKDCYWIIDKKQHQVFGPMEKSEFLKKKKSLGIKMELVWPQ